MEQVYLITPGEYEGMNIVKVGMHKGNTNLRVNSYGRKTKIHSIRSVMDCKFLEKEIIKHFKKTLKYIKDVNILKLKLINVLIYLIK